MPNFLKIQVFNGDMTELIPTSSAKARILIRNKKAKVICTHPFAIRLNCVKIISEKDKNKILSMEK